MMSLNLSGPMAPAIFSNLQLTSPSFGDAISNCMAKHSVIFFDELDAPFRRPLSSLASDYSNQIINMDAYDSMQTPISRVLTSNETELEIGGFKTQNLAKEPIAPYHLLNARADKNQFFSYYNYSNDSFLSHGLNGSWAMGVFRDSTLRSKKSLRSQFSNPWLNFSATGTTFGSTYKGMMEFDITFALSAGKNKFKTNEIFGERNSSAVAFFEIQPKSNIPSLQLGLMKENNASLGLSGSGAFDGGNNQLTSFMGLSHAMAFAGGKLFGSFYWGKSSGMSNDLGMIQSLTNLYSSSFGLGFLKSSIFYKADTFLITIDQPIRIESGGLQLNVPIYRTKEKNVLFNSFNFDLDPSGREIHTKAEYLTSYKNIGFGLTLGYKSDPYHIKFMDDYWYTSLGFNIKI
jgi:hypothetical protein